MGREKKRCDAARIEIMMMMVVVMMTYNEGDMQEM